jgi:hypothetical protein
MLLRGEGRRAQHDFEMGGHVGVRSDLADLADSTASSLT